MCAFGSSRSGPTDRGGGAPKASISPLSEPSREARKAAGGHDFRLPPPLPSPSSPSWAPAPRH
jgi:hypothetical protein